MNKYSKRLLISSVLAATAATVVLGFTAPALAHDTLKLEAPKPLLAPTPPMGWNSWNKFGCKSAKTWSGKWPTPWSPPA